MMTSAQADRSLSLFLSVSYSLSLSVSHARTHLCQVNMIMTNVKADRSLAELCLASLTGAILFSPRARTHANTRTHGDYVRTHYVKSHTHTHAHTQTR